MTEQRDETDDQEAKPIHDALLEAQEELRRALGELHLRAQRQDYEAQLQAYREIQEAEAEKAAGDNEAYWTWLEGVHGAAREEQNVAAAFEHGHDYQRGLYERAIDAQRRVAESYRAYQETAQSAQEEFRSSLREIYNTYIGRLKEVWASLDPNAVEPQDLASLAQLLSVAAQGLSATIDPGAPSRGQ